MRGRVSKWPPAFTDDPRPAGDPAGTAVGSHSSPGVAVGIDRLDLAVIRHVKHRHRDGLAIPAKMRVMPTFVQQGLDSFLLLNPGCD